MKIGTSALLDMYLISLCLGEANKESFVQLSLVEHFPAQIDEFIYWRAASLVKDQIEVECDLFDSDTRQDRLLQKGLDGVLVVVGEQPGRLWYRWPL